MVRGNRARSAAPASANEGPFGIKLPGVRMRTSEEFFALFDREAQRELGMSGREFIAAWDRGDFVGREDELPVARVLILAPGDWYYSLPGVDNVAGTDPRAR